jgi:DHA1 family tetracycline resistance protein-like MFS transporter
MSTPANANRAIALVLGVLFIDMVCQSMVYPSLPELLKQIARTDDQGAARLYGIMSGAYALCELFAAPMLGQLSDRYGRKPILVIGCLGSALCFLTSALAPSAPALIAAYAIAGLTSAFYVVINATIADLMPPDQRAKGYGYIGATFGIGFVFGPVLGAILAPLGLRAPFFVSAGLLVVAFLAVVFLFRETLATENRAVGLRLSEIRPWTALFSLRQHPLVSRLAITVAFNAFAMQMLIGVWVPYCTYRYGFGVAENGWLLAGFGLVTAVGQAVVVPRLVPRIGNRNSILFGLTFSVLSYALYAWSPTAAWFVGVVLVGSLAAIDEPALQAIVSETVGDSAQGTTQGGLATINSLAGIFGPVVGTTIFSITSGPRSWVEWPGATYSLCAVLVFFGLMVAVNTLRRYRGTPENATGND